MIPPQYVKPYVQRGKSDAADAEAICEAASRPKLRKNFVPIKSPEQQGAQMLTRVRVCGASKTSRKSRSGIPNSPRSDLRMRRHRPSRALPIRHPRHSLPVSRPRANGLWHTATRTVIASCASAGSPTRRRRKSSRPCCTRKAARRKACLISCRGSPRWPAARHTRTRVLSLRAGRSACWNAPPNHQNRRAPQPEARLRGCAS